MKTKSLLILGALVGGAYMLTRKADAAELPATTSPDPLSDPLAPFIPSPGITPAPQPPIVTPVAPPIPRSNTSLIQLRAIIDQIFNRQRAVTPTDLNWLCTRFPIICRYLSPGTPRPTAPAPQPLPLPISILGPKPLPPRPTCSNGQPATLSAGRWICPIPGMFYPT